MSTIHYVPAASGTSPPNPEEWVYIVSSALGSLPSPGTRVGTGDASNMPTIQASTGNNALKTANAAAKYRIVGCYVRGPSASILQDAVLKIGNGTSSLGNVPTDIIVDRCIVRGDPTLGGRRGVLLDGIRSAVIDSYIYDCKEVGADTQAVWAYNTPGPIKVVNNYLEGAGENMMTGGQDPAITDLVPSDIEIRKNYFFKKPYLTDSWGGAGWDVKNLLEFKNAQRVICEGNYFDTCYADAQSGYFFLLTPRNQNGGASWCVVQDITFRLNKAVNVGQGVNILGNDDSNTSQVTKRVTIQDNTMEVVSQNGEDRRAHLISLGGAAGGAQDVQIINNTWLIMAAGGTGGYLASASNKIVNPIWRNNIITSGNFGIFGDGAGTGNVGFTAHCTGETFTYNLIIGGTSSDYTGRTGCQFPAAATDVFTNYGTGDYTVKSPYTGDGSDGTDPGADITALNAATLHSVDGAWGAADNLYTDQAYTNAELPRTYINTDFVRLPTSGTTRVCTTAAEFTTALANCVNGDVIELQAGTTFTGSFTMRAR